VDAASHAQRVCRTVFQLDFDLIADARFRNLERVTFDEQIAGR